MARHGLFWPSAVLSIVGFSSRLAARRQRLSTLNLHPIWIPCCTFAVG
jgi:hypothetical protein